MFNFGKIKKVLLFLKRKSVAILIPSKSVGEQEVLCLNQAKKMYFYGFT